MTSIILLKKQEDVLIFNLSDTGAAATVGTNKDGAECSYIDISEIIVYPRSLSAKEDSQIKVYIAHEWG